MTRKELYSNMASKAGSITRNYIDQIQRGWCEHITMDDLYLQARVTGHWGRLAQEERQRELFGEWR